MMRHSDSRSSQNSSQLSVISHSAAPLTASCFSVTLIASLGALTAGTILAYPSSAIGDINNNANPFHLNEAEETWFGSLVFLGSFVGTLFAGLLMDRIGRKFVIMMMALPVVIGWEIIIASRSPTTVLIGRAITGFGRGILLPTVHVYIAEIAPAPMRGTLLAVASLSNVLGNLYEYLLGSFLHWNWLALSSMVIPVIMCVLMCFVVESPRFMMQIGRKDDVEFVLTKLRDNSSCIEDEMQEIEDNMQTNVQFHFFGKGSFYAPPLRKPMLIALGIFSIKELSGTTYIRTYAFSIIHEAGLTGFEANTESIVIGLVGVGGVLVSCVLIDLLGRRALLVTSCLAMAVCLAILGAYFKLLDMNNNFAADNLYWMVPVGLVMTNFSYALAFDTIPWLIVSEFYSTSLRGKAHSVIGCWESVMSFLVTFFFSLLGKYDLPGSYIGFIICAIVCLIGSVLLFFIVPETKKETLEQIQNIFDSPKITIEVIPTSTHM